MRHINSKSLLNFFFIKKIQQAMHRPNELHIKSFLKNTTTSSAINTSKITSRVLHNLLIVLKRILHQYKLQNTFKPYLSCRQSFLGRSLFANFSHCLVFGRIRRDITVYTLVSVYKRNLYTYKKRCFLFFGYYIILLFSWNARIQYVSFPKRTTKKTVLRSPHIDKRSREQFEKVTRHSLLYIPFFFSEIQNILKYSVPSFGIEYTQKTTLNR